MQSQANEQSYYYSYLESPEWKSKRSEILKRDGYRCFFCGCTENLNVHHLTYKNVFREEPEDLITLCRDCHKKGHDRKVFIDTSAASVALALKIERKKTEREKQKTEAILHVKDIEMLCIKDMDCDIFSSIEKAIRSRNGGTKAGVTGAIPLLVEYRANVIGFLLAATKSIEKTAETLGTSRQKIKEIMEKKYGKEWFKMPKIDMDAYRKAKPMGEAPIVPGCYVARITEVKTAGYDRATKRYIDYIAEKEYAKVLFDIAEGEYAGTFSGESWQDEDKDNRHCFYLSWKNLGSLKSNFEALEASNPGFDPMKAFGADQWHLFVGRLVGLRWGAEEKVNDDGDTVTYMALPNLCDVAKVRSGEAKVPKPRKSGGERPKRESQPYGGDDAIPF